MAMEQTDVIIVGAGPSGLALALALSHRQINSIVLEKNLEICQDPRAIAIAGDTCRIVQLLGIRGRKLQEIGRPVESINIHREVFTVKPYVTLDHESDLLEQALEMGTCILQPGLEREMRNLVESSKYADLRTECTVSLCREVKDSMEIVYQSRDGTTHQLKGRFLVGADGKRGVVRKDFLEPRGIKQETGIHNYSATWIAANLRITPPTPESHPDFPLWKLGFEPEDAWDLFWPRGFHFCNHPTKPVAAGRFGPKTEKFWRFEYELPAGYEAEDWEKDLETQLAPHLTLNSRQIRGKKLSGPVKFPWECVEVLRCQPALFTHKVVNRWFENRTILIGDAAHVFPPFGAQGIANGLRDAFTLSWRLDLILGSKPGGEVSPTSKHLLDVWSQERRKGVDDSSKLTMQNGHLMANKSSLLAVGLGVLNNFLEYVPPVRFALHRMLVSDAEGYAGVEGGFFLASDYGGRKVAQIWVRAPNGSRVLSDQLFWKSDSVLTLLLLAPHDQQEATELAKTLESARLPPKILSHDTVAIQYLESSSSSGSLTSPWKISEYSVCTPDELGRTEDINLLPGYNPTGFRNRFQAATRYVLMRSDFIIFSQASTLTQLSGQLQRAADMLAGSAET